MAWFGFRPLALPHQAVIDFLIADRCLLCKQGRSNRTGDSGGEARFAGSLAAGHQLRLFKLIRLVNHPVCPSCSRGFEDTLGPGVLALSLDTRVLRRVRQGEQQSKTQRGQRAANVRGAFAADRALAADRDIVLVDDLVTSGSTAAACAAALLGAGAASLKVLCFGRAM